MAEVVPPPPTGDQPVPRFPGGAYAVEGVLGTGGMAVVYRARDLRHARDVAIKVLRVGVAEAIGSERFLREIAVTAAFTHPHILPLLDSGEAVDAEGRPTPFYVMPLIRGESLAGRLHAQDRLPVAEAVRLTGEILEALRYAHDQGVIHRDIKPANVLLSDGHAVVADFGVARLMRGEGPGMLPGSMTATGVALGTPAYMSPEQAMGNTNVDARCDLYAAGCVLYEMLCGASPFDAPTPQAFIARKFAGTLQPVSQLRPELPTGMDALLARAMAPDPAHRFGSAEEFLGALRRLEVAGPAGSDIVSSGPSPAMWTGTPAPQGEASPAGSSGLVPSPVPSSIAAPASWPWRRWTMGAVIGAALLAASVWVDGRDVRGGTGASPAVPMLELTHIAVLPPEIVDADSALAAVLHGDIIDSLARFPALTTTSRNGVLGFTSADKVDRVARTLGTGSVITWRLHGRKDSVWVTARLIDGETARQVATYTVGRPRGEVQAVGSTVVDSVTAFLRRQVGIQLEERAARQVANRPAWQLVRRASILEQAIETADPAQARGMMDSVEVLLEKAQRLDRGWDLPVERHMALKLTRARQEEEQAADRDALHRVAPTRWEAIHLANASLEGLRDSSRVLALRGFAWLELWQAATDVLVDSLRRAAESDLRAALAINPQMAPAWNWLSYLHEFNGDFQAALDAALKARTADTYLETDAELMVEMQFFLFAVGRADHALRACLQSRSVYPQMPPFWDCELTYLGWTAGRKEDVARAWNALRDARKRDLNGPTAKHDGPRLLFVAAIAARAGLKDSARHMVQRVLDDSTYSTSRLHLHEAYVWTMLNDRGRAIARLQEFLRQYPVSRGYVRNHPWFARLADDPEFARTTSAR